MSHRELNLVFSDDPEEWEGGGGRSGMEGEEGGWRERTYVGL